MSTDDDGFVDHENDDRFSEGEFLMTTSGI